MPPVRHRPNGVPGENRGLVVCRQASDNGRTTARAEKSADGSALFVPGDTERECGGGNLWLRGWPCWTEAVRKAGYIHDAYSRFHSYGLGVGLRNSARRVP